ncbi:hypothetical protein [Haloarchaeobius sp. HME9146]|uniref:hypothetical protein n=1 Tax=Haloarchaeobius sp. HME9146 TaxID=2978732 RepID=UPI0021C1A98A|nr:hypothetical protein [Haloarchaeobius sp. HME9146]MCT9094976.1 hypothetical protein [Haloarchaeobius sp. HME9146]
MPDGSTHDERTRRAVLKRVVTTAGSVAVVGAAGATETTSETTSQSTSTDSPATGGSGIRRQMAFEAPYDDEGDYVGDFLVAADEVTGEVDTSAVDQCGLTDWDPSNTVVYEAVLTTELATDPQGAEVQILTNGEKDHIESGAVFIVSDAETCGNGYVGVDTEAVSDARIPEGSGTTAAPTADDGQESIPGFELAGTVAGIASLLGLARWRDGDA